MSSENRKVKTTKTYWRIQSSLQLWLYVVMFGISQRSVAVKATLAGANDFLLKPSIT